MTNETPVIEDPKAVLDALERAKADAKRFREERDALQTQLADLESGGTEAKYKQRLVQAELRTKLLGLGVDDVDRLVKYAPLDTVQLEDDGFKGLDEAVTTLQADFPELFDPKARARKQRRTVESIDATAQGDTPQKSGTELQVDRLLQSLGR